MKRILFVLFLLACVLLTQGNVLAGLTSGIAAVSLDDSQQPPGDDGQPDGGANDGGSTDGGGSGDNAE